MDLPTFVRARREHLGLTLDGVVACAERRGYRLQSARISQVANGITGVTQLPTPKLLKSLAAGLGVPVLVLGMASLVGMGVVPRGGPYDRAVDGWVTREPIEPSEDTGMLDVAFEVSVQRPALPRPRLVEFMTATAQ